MEGNNNIFLVGDDVLGYLVQLMYKKYSMTFIWDIYLLSADLMTNSWVLYTSPLYAHVSI